MELLQAEPGRGRQRSLARRLGKAPAQVSQWVNRTRTITEETAREIERTMQRPTGWMDSDPKAPATTGGYHVTPPPLARNRPPPPSPPPDFADRRLVSDSDWSLLQDVKTAATPAELAAIRKRAALIEKKVAERLEELAPTHRRAIADDAELLRPSGHHLSQ